MRDVTRHVERAVREHARTRARRRHADVATAGGGGEERRHAGMAAANRCVRMEIITETRLRWRTLEGMMKATPEQQHALSQLQRSESKARRIAWQARNMEETKVLEQIIAQRRSLRIRQAELSRQLDDLDGRMKEEQAKARTIEDGIAAIDAKLKGVGVTPKEVISLDQRRGSLAAQLDESQNRELELIEQSDRLRNAHAIITTDEAKLAERGEQVKAKREAKLDKFRKQVADINADRLRLAAKLPRDVVSKFQQLVKENDGQAVITYTEGRVEGASEELGTAEMERLRNAAPDELVFFDYHNMMVARF